MPSRETEMYKDKVEVSLDGRQIFYLFFGGAVIVGMVFVLGVLVGRRVEARGHLDRARTTAAADPLAALDRLEGNGGMAFRGALGGKDTPSGSPVETKIEAMAKKPADEPKKKVDEKKVDEKKLDEKKPDEKKAAKSSEEPKARDEKKADEKATEKSSDKKAEKKSDEKKSDDKKSDDKKSASADEKKAEEKSRYTLQLSSFQDKAEAEAYLSQVKSQGFSAQITIAQVDGKGTWYRVRMGSYRSLDAATSAKQEFEKTAAKSASVMKL